MRPLAGIRVLDLTTTVGGPMCSQMLADMGADVIKIEPPDRGDDSRHFPPFVDGQSYYFAGLNRNKRSLAVDLKTKEGHEIFSKLAKKSDILLDNFRPGVMKRLRIDYPAVKKLNRRIISCAISAYGQTGPRKDEGGYDLVMQGITGTMISSGEEGAPPLKVVPAVPDVAAAMLAAFAVMNALWQRTTTGEGQYIDLSLFESTLYTLAFPFLYLYLGSGVVPRRLGSAHPTIVPYQAFKAKDSYFTLAVLNAKQWASMCEAVAPELKEDPLFNSVENRSKNRKLLLERLQSIFEKQTSAHWIELLTARGVPCGPINNIEQALKDKQTLARGTLQDMPGYTGPLMKTLFFPAKFSKVRQSPGRPAPKLGEHTVELLRELGYAKSEIASLRKTNVIRS